MDTKKNIRAHSRIPIKLELMTERIPDKEKRGGYTKNISMDGLYIYCEDPFSPGEKCTVKIYVGGRESGTVVHSRITIIYVDDSGMGAQFTSHFNPESYQHLHNLILYNSDQDAEKIEMEINQHLEKIRES